MGSLTDSSPKALVSLSPNVTILDLQITSLKDNYVNELIITTGPFADQLIQHVQKNFPSMDIHFIHNPDYQTTNYIYSMYLIPNELINDDVILMHGDLVFPQELMSSFFSSSLENFVLEIGKEIPHDSSCFEYVGIAKFSPKGVLHLKETLDEMAREEGFLDFYFTDIIQRLIYKGFTISTQTISPELWVDIDYPRDLYRAETEVLPLLLS